MIKKVNKMKNNKIINKTDSYKASHYLQFPPDAENTFYYIESRGGGDKIKFFGLQAIIKKYLMDVINENDVADAKKFFNAHGLPFNEDGWNKIAQKGYLPLEIKAVKEGTVVNTKRPLVTVTCTEDGFEWLPGWCETMLMQVWYPITVATNSWKCKQVINKYLEETGDPAGIMFKLHDFGYRGVSSEESAELGGMAHLVNFMGTDTIAGIYAAQEYYNTNEMVGFSIPAAEHSTMTSWGKENEKMAYKNMLDKFAEPGKLVAVVSDSYDLNNAVVNIWGKDLKKDVLDSGATIVIRPDSGEPKDVVVRTLLQLEATFGTTTNDKGYKVLNPAVRLIQGDGISDATAIAEILEAVKSAGFSADNLAFGMGGGLLQQVNRDTYKFAMKCSAIKRAGNWQDVFKCPVDAPWKASKAGRFNEYSDFVTVFKDGKMIKEYTFNEVRNNE
jgi:nicotinamide phosphoribosyltransferase